MRKKLLYITISILVFFACNTQVKDSKNETTETQEIEEIEIDQTSEIDSLAQHFEKKGSSTKIKNALPNNMGFYMYFQIVNGKAKNPKLYIQFDDHDAYRFSVDGERYLYKTKLSKGKGDDKICWYDYPMSSMDVKLLYSIVKSETTRVIFSDGTSLLVDQNTKDALKKTLDYFEILDGKFPAYL